MVFCGRYIDDDLLLWDGDMTLLANFMEQLNNNGLGISLQFEVNQTKINFLDLNFEIRDLITSTYFKSTDRNGYIGQGSCHYPKWLESVPKSQFIRLRWNCTVKDEFLEQASALKIRFVDKDY